MPRHRPTRFATSAALGFAAVMLVMLSLTASALGALLYVSEQQEDILIDYGEDLVLAERLRFDAEQIVATTRGYLLSGDPELLSKQQAAHASFQEGLRLLVEKEQVPAAKTLLDQVAIDARDYEAASDRALTARADHPETAQLLRLFDEDLLPSRRRMEESLQAFLSSEKQQLESGYRHARQLTSRAMILVVGLLAVGLLLSLGLAVRFTRKLNALYEAERQAVAAREELLHIVAHDLRSPLSAVLMNAAIIRKSATSDSAKAVSRAESIENVIKRMEHLIGSLLDAASVEVGRLSIKRQRCEAADLISQTVQIFGSLAAAKSIRLEGKAVPGDPSAFADPERALQVLSNLVGNAIKFTPEGGAVELSVESIEGFVRFEIKDTGPGIEPEHLPHLFERYWRAEAQGRKGTGLGLYISKGIVEAHGGKIWVQSRPGEGSTFFFTLPVPAERASSGVRVEAAPRDSTS
ncbi:MAG: histidine kinase [Planctomycetes bacterium]|nr:histidine kinase [Planctomycetota bacterium]